MLTAEGEWVKDMRTVEAGGQTFIIDIKCVQNGTWQGTVSWVQKQQKIPFRSALELIRLLDSAVGTEDLPNVEEWK